MAQSLVAPLATNQPTVNVGKAPLQFGTPETPNGGVSFSPGWAQRDPPSSYMQSYMPARAREIITVFDLPFDTSSLIRWMVERIRYPWIPAARTRSNPNIAKAQSGLTLPCAGAPAHEKSLKNSPWNALTRMTCQLPSVQAREIIKELASSSSQEDKQRQRDQTRFAGLLEVVRCPQKNGSTLLHIGFIKIL
jgi:hypothetical protein